MESNSEFLRFIAFGCWNNLRNNQYNRVFETLRINLEDESNPAYKSKFIAVLGDNYYPEKISYEGLKYPNVSLMEMFKGFNKLNKIDIDKKLIMGNHDIDDGLDYDCSVLKTQLKMFNYDTKFPFGFDKYYVNGRKILILYIDTTVYQYEAVEEPNCLTETLNKTPLDILNRQHRFIIDKIEKNEDAFQIIICGHEPIITKKPKKGKETPVAIEKLLTLFASDDFRGKRFTYICADYHSYQHGTIHIHKNNVVIEQLVFGTGGAELDPSCIVDARAYEYNLNDIRYSFTINNGESSHGYGIVTIDNNGVNHVYENVEKYEHKYKLEKYRKKYSKLKKILELLELSRIS